MPARRGSKSWTTFGNAGRFQVLGPPRQVPLSVRLRLLFGGFLNQFGWFFFGFGMIFYWVFYLNADLTSWLVFQGEVQTAPGQVVRCEATNASENNVRVYVLDYEFEWDGDTRRGTSYSTGGTRKKGDSVTVEFPEGRAEKSRIEGMRRFQFGPAAGLVLIFPLVGFAFVASGMRRGRRIIRLLKQGELAAGNLVSQEKTTMEVNRQPVIKYTFEFEAPGQGTYQCIAKTYLTETLTKTLTDDEHEPLIYRPANPNDAMMLDYLPGKPSIDEQGNVILRRSASTLILLIVPTLSLAGHVGYGLWRYG